MVSARVFNILNSLSSKIGWLERLNYPDALVQLLEKDCHSESERLLVQGLIERFRYVSTEEESKLIRSLAKSIFSIPDFNPNTFMIVAMVANHDPDSSQYFIYRLRTEFAINGIQKKNLFINHCGRVHKYLTEDVTKIVLFDEFIGTGSTVLNRINLINQSLKQSKKKTSKIQFVVRTLAATEIGLSILNSNGIDAKCMITIKKGISDFYRPEDVIKNLELMKNIESSLADSYFDVKLPSLGYGQCEALYYREGGNIPNNVFPIFWWPRCKDNTDRVPMFIRVMIGDK